MAYSEKQWLDVEGYYKSGLSLSQIEAKTGIGKSTISKRAKKQQWQQGANTDYIEAKELIVEKKSTENQHLLNIADEVAHERITHKKLIYDNATKLAGKLNTMADQIDEPQDLKHLVDANDKLSITLKVSERYAPKTEITNTNATQNNTKRVTIARRSDRRDD